MANTWQSRPRPDVDDLWQLVEKTVTILQSGGRLPPTPKLLDPQLKNVKNYLRYPSTGGPSAATRVAADIARRNRAAAYVALELVAEYHRACRDTRSAERVGKEAAKHLEQVEKALAKERKKGRSP